MIKTKRFLLDKLGRDKTEELFSNDNCTVKFHVLEDNEEFLEALTQKIFEELEEVFSANTKEEIIEELGDLDEVLDAFKALIKADQKEIDAKRAAKRDIKGAFKERIYLHYVDVPEGSEQEKYCLSQPEKYPEIIEELDPEPTS